MITAISLESGIMEGTRKLPMSVQEIPRIRKILKYNHILKLRLKVCTHITGAGIVQNKIPDTYIHTHTHTLPISRPIYIKKESTSHKKKAWNKHK
jgi:hypothetical protein